MSSLFQRFKSKKVGQWTLGYLAGAFVALQLMDALESALDLSQQAQQGIVALLATGLVITGVVAWFHGDKGQQRVRPAEIAAVGLTLVVGLSVAGVLWARSGIPSPSKASIEAVVGSVLPSSEDSGSDTAPTVGGPEDQPAVEPESTAPETPPAPEPESAIRRIPPPTVTPEDPTIFVDDSVRLELDTDQPAFWKSSDRSVAMVTSDGLVLGVGAGSARITADVGGTEVSTEVTIRIVTVTGIAISPVGTLRVGESARPEVVVRMANGQTRGRGGLNWVSSDTSVIRIESRGTLSAVGAGSARIRAEADGEVETMEVLVVAPPEAEAPIRPVTPDILFPVLEDYRAALEGQDMGGVTAVYPGISPEEEAGWETLFRLGDLSVEFTNLTVNNASATTAEVEFEQLLSGNRIERNVTRFIATLALEDEGWRIQELRTVGSSP